jgi:hypothetical protein
MYNLKSENLYCKISKNNIQYDDISSKNLASIVLGGVGLGIFGLMNWYVASKDANSVIECLAIKYKADPENIREIVAKVGELSNEKQLTPTNVLDLGMEKGYSMHQLSYLLNHSKLDIIGMMKEMDANEVLRSVYSTVGKSEIMDTIRSIADYKHTAQNLENYVDKMVDHLLSSNKTPEDLIEVMEATKSQTDYCGSIETIGRAGVTLAEGVAQYSVDDLKQVIKSLALKTDYKETYHELSENSVNLLKLISNSNVSVDDACKIMQTIDLYTRNMNISEMYESTAKIIQCLDTTGKTPSDARTLMEYIALYSTLTSDYHGFIDTVTNILGSMKDSNYSVEDVVNFMEQMHRNFGHELEINLLGKKICDLLQC